MAPHNFMHVIIANILSRIQPVQSDRINFENSSSAIRMENDQLSSKLKIRILADTRDNFKFNPKRKRRSCTTGVDIKYQLVSRLKDAR